MKKNFFFIVFFTKILFASSCYSILTKTDVSVSFAPNNVIGNIPTYNKCSYFDESILFDNYFSYIGCSKNKKIIEKLYERLIKQGFRFKDEKIVKHKITNKDIYVIFPIKAHIKKYYNLKKIYKKYSIKNVGKMFPNVTNKISITYIKLKHSKFLPTINVYRFYKLYKKHNFSQKILVLYKGSITLENLYKKINNKNILEKKRNKYILKYPLYIAPTATLVINNKILLLESYPKPIFVMYHGNLYIKNSKIYAWNIKNNKYYPHPFIPDDELLLVGKQRPRPYFLGLAGSKTIFLNNIVRGLGFHDKIGTFGVSLAQYPKDIIFKYSFLYRFLSSRKNVTGIFEGNDIYDNMMGFYTNEAKNVLLIGNEIHDNLIYDVDPHDYSEGLIIVRNIVYNSHHAHGIVISRHVENSIIAENFSFKNHSAGIMLDRLSNHNIVYKNLSMENGYMGITVQESDNALVEDNYLIRNYIDGIIVRNALRNTIKNNYIYENGKNGIEVYVKDLKSYVYRNFLRDPYHKAASAVLIHNKVENSYNYNLMVKNSAAVKLVQNDVKNKNLNRNYGGDLNSFIEQIKKNEGYFTLFGRGKPYRRISIDLLKLSKSSLNVAISIIRDISMKNLNAGLVLSYIYRIRRMYNLEDKELKRVATNLISHALNKLGFVMLIKARKNNYKNKEVVLNALSYIIEASIMGDKNAAVDISYLPILSYIKIDDINKAFFIAKNRMKKGFLFDKSEYNNCEYCKADKVMMNLTKSYLKVFLYNQKQYKFKNFYEYTIYMKNNSILFSKDLINTIKNNDYLSNIAKFKYFRMQKIVMSNAKKNNYCRYYLNKTFNRNKQVQSLMQYHLNDDYEKYSYLIDEYINKINQFRKRKIDKKKIYKILKEKNEKIFNIFTPIIDE